ncbi:MAG: hypothetical protein ABIM44_04910 [candidate division WOR-3 bacterium]
MSKENKKYDAITTGVAGVAGVVTGVAISQLIKKETQPVPTTTTIDLTEIIGILNSIKANIEYLPDSISKIIEKIDELLKKIEGIVPPTQLPKRYFYKVIADKTKAYANQIFSCLFENPPNKFTLYIYVDGATDIYLSLSPDGGMHIFDLGKVESFISSGYSLILVEHACNFIQIRPSNPVTITIIVGGIA